MIFTRTSGILLHPTSLPGGHGIGDLGQSAYRFVDFLNAAGMGLWQVLPLGPTGAANSPYQSLSSFAGNPLLISLEALVAEDVLRSSELPDKDFPESRTEYNRARSCKAKTLRRAYTQFTAGNGKKGFRNGFADFCSAESAWLDDFTLFMALKHEFSGSAWFEWPANDLRMRDQDAMAAARRDLADETGFHAFCQYAFFSQWRALREYAADKGVRLMGDIPIYVAHDSADVWTSPQFFTLDKKGRATMVAGVPPDYFSPTGQLWGNPLYQWEVLAENGFDWWKARIHATLQMVDMLRIDHFRGFEAYWQVDAREETAVNGKWVKGPGAKLFTALKQELGALPIVAEDLGIITPEVTALRKQFGMPGMKVLQFAFCDGAEMYLPHTYESECVVYTATHDNDTTVGWYRAEGGDYEHMDRNTIDRERDRTRRYLARDGSDIHMDLIRLAMGSVAAIAIFPMQDVLGLDNSARMNRPGITDNQWEWRMTAEQLQQAPSGILRDMAELYGRTG